MNRFFTVIIFLFISSTSYYAQQVSIAGKNISTHEYTYQMYPPPINYITDASAQKYVISVIKGYGSPGYVDYDSLIYNARGVIAYQYKMGNHHYYEYAPDGKLSKTEIYLQKGDPSSLKKRQVYEYTSSGDIAVCSEETRGGSVGTYFTKTVYIYSGSGQLIEKDFNIDYADMDLHEKSKYLYTYDETGNLSGITNQNLNEGVWIPGYEITMSYDANNHLIDSLYLAGWVENYWNYQYREETTFDESGRQVLKMGFSNWTFGTELAPLDSAVFKYDDSGRLETKIKYTLQNSGYESEKRIYNEAGLILSLEKRKGSAGYEEAKRYSYKYIGGKCETITFEYYIDSLWRPWVKTEYYYDDAGNCTKAEMYGYTNDQWIVLNNESDIEIPGLNRTVRGYKAEISYTLIEYTEGGEVPDRFTLYQNYPNPFNPGTKIYFFLLQSGETSLKIYDTLGRQVAELINGEMEKGLHEVNFSGRNLSSGVYIYRLQSGNFTESKKMMLMK